MDKGIKYYDYS